MKKYLFAALFFVAGLGAVADDRAATEADRIIRDFGRLEALLDQPVPADFDRWAPNIFRSPYGTTMVGAGPNGRIILIGSGAVFWTSSEATRFIGLMHDFMDRSGGQAISDDSYIVRDLVVTIQPYQQHPEGGFVSGVEIQRW